MTTGTNSTLLAEASTTRFHNYRAVVTSPQVWDAIRERHEVTQFSSFSDPTGTFMGGPGEIGTMETTYGLRGADYPFIGARKHAITLLAEWTLCIELNGSMWDDWDECYKDAAFRPGPLRKLIDAERDRLKREDVTWRSKSRG